MFKKFEAVGGAQDVTQREDRKRSVQQFESDTQTVTEADAKKRSIQQFTTEVPQAGADVKKRSVQQFESGATKALAEGNAKTRSVQQFAPAVTQAEKNAKKRSIQNTPQSVSGSRPSLSAGNTITTMQGQNIASKIPSMCRPGSSNPMLESIHKFSMKSFNHDYTFPLGERTLVVFENDNLSNSYILQVCSREEWHPARSQLVDIARSDRRLVLTQFAFYDEEHENFWVGSEEAGICLADIVSCSWEMNEVVASVILSEIVQALYYLRQQGIQYNNIKASNIYLSEHMTGDGKGTGYRVQLANFAPSLNPVCVKVTDHENTDCIDVGWLAIYMLTRADKPDTNSVSSGQTMARYGPFIIDLAKATPSQDFVDFLEASALCDVDKLLKHKFLRHSDISCLHPYFIHAGYFSVRPSGAPGAHPEAIMI